MVALNATYRNPSVRSKTQMSRRKRNMGPGIARTMTFNLHADHVGHAKFSHSGLFAAWRRHGGLETGSAKVEASEDHAGASPQPPVNTSLAWLVDMPRDQSTMASMQQEIEAMNVCVVSFLTHSDLFNLMSLRSTQLCASHFLISWVFRWWFPKFAHVRLFCLSPALSQPEMHTTVELPAGINHCLGLQARWCMRLWPIEVEP